MVAVHKQRSSYTTVPGMFSVSSKDVDLKMFHFDLARWASEVRDEFHDAELVALERRWRP